MNANIGIMKNNLEGSSIFLSASIPSPDRDKRYYINTNPLDITDAVVAISKIIFSEGGKIIYGGHPTISPLILSVARIFKQYYKQENLPLVSIYQSKFFESKISQFTEELINLELGEINWTNSVKNDKDLSLMLMRKEMIESRNIVAAIFIGGMEGIAEEFKLFVESHPNFPMYLIASSGGATRFLFENQFAYYYKEVFKWNYFDENLINDLRNSKQFLFLAKEIVSDIIKKGNIQIPGGTKKNPR